MALTPNERAELENLRAECKRLRDEVEVERDRANDLLTDKNWAEAECGRIHVKASEATAKAERQRKQLHSQCKTIESRGAEIARLENEVKVLREKYEGAVASHKALAEVCTEISDELLTVRQSHTEQPETRRVKVRCNLKPEDISIMVNRCYADGYNQLATCKKVMDHVLLNAVLEVPPGVPTLDELAMIGSVAWANHKEYLSGVELHHASAVVIAEGRDSGA